ncbi:MAG TPA: ATP-dependent Clp protease proteolytic subunit [Tepidisphaeraceae bacterium]|jgi:ATP-dependent Clp protease protease subunit|nr:ATP-dependent Clp protease proteolytic subunit [Tepidisphaeraceae bacterium]
MIDLNQASPQGVGRLVERAASMPTIVPGRGPVASPVAMPGPPGPGGYNRYREMTLEEMLLENRVIFLVGEINHVSAARVYMQMLYLQSVKRDQDINLYINSPGGVVDDTLAIYDVMKFLQCDVATYCIGRAESGGAVVFMAGKKGKRYILPNAKVMIHQPFGGVYGQAADIEIQAEEILKTKNTLISVMAKCTGQPIERIRDDSERDRFFDAKQAVEYGLCDEILGEDSPPSVAEAASDANKPK